MYLYLYKNYKMANLLTVTKLANEQFSFILNGDTANTIINTRNDLLTVGNECHFKTSNGANLINEQNVVYSNVSLFDGVVPVLSPTSVLDLFDKLTALGFFEWITGGGVGVNRFEDLLDTFEFFGKAGQFVVVSGDELQLTTISFTPITSSTGLSDMPSTLIAGKMLQVNATGNAYELVDPPSGANGYNQLFTYSSPDLQEFALDPSASLNLVLLNGGTILKKNTDWTQVGSILTVLIATTILSDLDEIIAIGTI